MKAEVRDVIQIKPNGLRRAFSDCFAVVREVHGWGVKADVIGPGTNDGGPNTYPIRLAHEDYVVIGKEWSPR